MKTKFFLIAMIAFLGFSNGSFAQDGKWSRKHPRRDEVNDRLGNQNKRIRDEVKDGEMTRAQAAKLHQRDRSVRLQERNMARKDGGHLTKEDQEKLNKRENRISRKIGN